MFWALLWRKVNAQNIRWETLSNGQFTLSTQSIKQNYLVILPHQHRTTVSLETYPFDNYCVWRNTIAISWIHWVVVSQMSFLVWVLVVHTWTWSSTLTLYPELKKRLWYTCNGIGSLLEEKLWSYVAFYLTCSSDCYVDDTKLYILFGVHDCKSAVSVMNEDFATSVLITVGQ